MKLSVVIPARSGLAPVLRCLESLRAAPQWGSFETIVVNCLGPKNEEPLRTHCPGTIILSGDPSWPITRQRDAGIAHAEGDAIAVLNDRYRVLPGWIDAIFRAHTQNYDVAAGPVIPAPHLDSLQQAIYLMEYSHLFCASGDGPLDAPAAAIIPGGNVSYKRSAFSLSNMAAASGELAFHAALFKGGAQFCFQSDMQVEFASPYSLKEYISERYIVSRRIAEHRSADLHRTRRCISMAAQLARPPLIIGRTGYRVFARKRFRILFLKTLPWIAFFGLIQAVGEISGYLANGPRAKPSAT